MSSLPIGRAPPYRPIAARLASPADFERVLPDLVELLREAVNAGASLGFLAPLTDDESWDYWLSIRTELRACTRLLVVARDGERLVGCGQLALVSWPNSRHRAEIQKLFVAPSHQGRGVGRSLITLLHDTARRCGRSLVHLSTRRGAASEGFYRRLGYLQAGVFPGFTLGPSGERGDVVALYRELG